jgi:hypothetical protein
MMKHAVITDATFDTSLNSIPKPRRGPINKMLVTFSAAYFAGALVTDLVYHRGSDHGRIGHDRLRVRRCKRQAIR